MSNDNINKSKLVIPMSSSGTCPRALSAQLLSYPQKDKPAWLATAAEEGNLHEDAIKSKLRSEGYVIEENREECKICKERYGTGRKGIHVEIDLGNVLLIGHLDGKIKDTKEQPFDNSTKWYKLECKSMSQFEFDRWMRDKFEAFPHYADQDTCYGIATGVPETLYVVKNRNSGYIDKTLLVNNPSEFEDIRARLFNIHEHVSRNELCNAEYNQENIWCRRCGFKSLCIPEPTEMNPVAARELQIAINTRELAKSTIKEQERIISYNERIIKDYLIGLKQNKIKFGGWSITLSENTPRVTYPVDLLRKAGVTNEQLEQSMKIGEVNEKYRLYMKNLNKEE